ncbi:BCCT family transporter [Leptospira sp. 96542]|nr:BCCT family transporter [Leptospira sp. 96542]
MAKYITIFIIGLFVSFSVFFPETIQIYTKATLSFILTKFGWLYLLIGFTLLCVCLYLVFGPYSSVKLGKDDDRPTYPFFSWLAMLFAAGMGIGMVFYGVTEPLSHYKNPPLGLAEPNTPEAGILALRYTIFHWGLHPWAIYGFLGLCIAYNRFRNNRTYLIGDLFTSLGLKIHWKQWIDVVSLIGVSFGVATSLGLGSLQIHSGLSYVFGLPEGIYITVFIILLTTVFYISSAMIGLDKGIKILSNGNMILAMILMFALLFLGPTNFIIELFFSSVGTYLQNLITMSFRMAPFTDSHWLRDWTFFYWAWWISWAPFVATFIARISKGRTIKEFLSGVLLVPCLLSAFWFSVLGGSAIYLERFEAVPIYELAGGDITKMLFVTFGYLPFGEVLSFLSIFLVFIFFITSADSATFVLGMFASGGKPDPSLKVKFLWGSMISILACALLLSGGLLALQTMAIIISFPFALVLFLLVWAFLKDIRKENP